MLAGVALSWGRTAAAQAADQIFWLAADSAIDEGDEFRVPPDSEVGLPILWPPEGDPMLLGGGGDPRVTFLHPPYPGATEPVLCPLKKPPDNAGAWLSASCQPLGGTCPSPWYYDTIMQVWQEEYTSTDTNLNTCLTHTENLTYTVNKKQASGESGYIRVFDADLTFQGGSADPQCNVEAETGFFMAKGTRKALSVRLQPADPDDVMPSSFNEQLSPRGLMPPYQVGVSEGGACCVDFYAVQTGGSPLTYEDLLWGWTEVEYEVFEETPMTPGQFYVQAETPGTCTVDLWLMFRCPQECGDWLADNGSTGDTVKLTVVGVDLAEMGLDAVETGGEIALLKTGADTWTNDSYLSDGDTNIVDPIWKDVNYDNVPEINDPVCYLSAKSPKIVNAKLKVVPDQIQQLAAKVRVTATPVGAGGEEGQGPGQLVFGPQDVTLSGGLVTVPTMTTSSGTVGSVVNNFTYQMKWEVSLDGGSSWGTFHQTEHSIFAGEQEPKGTYCSDIAFWELPYTWSSLSVTAKRMDWATMAGEGKSGNDLPARVADYIDAQPGHPGDFYSNPYQHLDAGTPGDCISLANLAATALRLLGTDAKPCRGYTRNKVEPAESATWGWTRKMHPYHGNWFLGWPGNNFEGFFFIGDLSLYSVFPDKAWTVWPRANLSVAQDKARYMPITVLEAVPVTELDWRIGNQPDVEWKPGEAVPGVSLQQFCVTWSSDPADDGQYTVQWDDSESKLKLADGQWVSVTGSGGYTLSCSKGSIAVDVVVAALPEADASGTARIVPARSLAPIP